MGHYRKQVLTNRAFTDIPRLVETGRDFQTTDPRDKVYGLICKISGSETTCCTGAKLCARGSRSFVDVRQEGNYHVTDFGNSYNYRFDKGDKYITLLGP